MPVGPSQISPEVGYKTGYRKLEFAPRTEQTPFLMQDFKGIIMRATIQGVTKMLSLFRLSQNHGTTSGQSAFASRNVGLQPPTSWKKNLKLLAAPAPKHTSILPDSTASHSSIRWPSLIGLVWTGTNSKHSYGYGCYNKDASTNTNRTTATVLKKNAVPRSVHCHYGVRAMTP